MTPASSIHLKQCVARYPGLAECRSAIIASVDLICSCHRGQGKLLVCGNGGSASDSDHIVGELVKSFALPRKISEDDRDRLCLLGGDSWEYLASKLQQGVAAISLTGHSALSTAIQNDTSASIIFAQQVYAYGRPGDIVIGLSTSGNSANVVLALETAKAFGLHTIGFRGATPARMDRYCDILLAAPAASTPLIQEFHLPIYHTICLMVEEELFGAKSPADHQHPARAELKQ
jgi:D-sedoheptulose 7-phosphate isomerase